VDSESASLVTVFPGNWQRGDRAVAAVYALFDGRDGKVLALFDGEELTARRTAAASAYAARKLPGVMRGTC
jgi:ornithine cyclodeaminase